MSSDALREAAQKVVDEAESDDNGDGEYIDYLVPFPALDALRAALAATTEPADYEDRVKAMADALHEDCRLEWRAIAVADPGRMVTQHMADAHYGKAHDLVRRLPGLIGGKGVWSTEPAGLDVERLQQAMKLAHGRRISTTETYAEAIARYYARLERPETPAEPEVASVPTPPDNEAGRPREQSARDFWPVDHEEGE